MGLLLLADYYSEYYTNSFIDYRLTLIINIFEIVCMWRIFEKANEAGWKCLIPIYSTIILFKITDVNPKVLWWILLPIIGWFIVLYYSIISTINLAVKFGQPKVFALGLLFLAPVFYGILAFGNYEYK